MFTLISPPPLRAQTESGREAETFLIIHSYHQTLGWNRSIQEGIEDQLADTGRSRELFVEYMDAKRMPGALSGEGFAAYLAEKYRSQPPDVILLSDEPALRFLAEHRAELFPRTPAVFCGIDHPQAVAELLTQEWLTGVVEGIDIARNIDLARRLWPETRHIYALGDDSKVAEEHRSALRALEPRYAGELRIHYLRPDSPAEMRRRLAELPNDSVVLYLHFHRSPEAGFLSFDEIIPAMAEASRAPVLGFWDFSVHLGLEGGYVTDGYKQGAVMASLARRILRGTPPSEIPVITDSPNSFMFNVPALREHGIGLGALPEEAVLLGYTAPLHHRYREETIAAGIILILLLATIALLSFNISQRRSSELTARSLNRRLREQLDQRSLLMREAHHRVKNNLQILESLITLHLIEFRSTAHPDGLTVLQQLQKRVAAIGMVHKTLYEAENWSSVPLDHYLSELIAHSLGPPHRELAQTPSGAGGSEHSTAHVDSRFEALRVGLDIAVPLGLILTELLQSRDHDGRNPEMGGDALPTVRVGLSRTGERQELGLLRYRDTAPWEGLQSGAAGTTAFGMPLIRSLTAQIDGELTMPDTGSESGTAAGREIEIRFPLREVTG
jgi:two-component sensor histidine kinase/ABC-type uncharacterized transport system substrate-binding protein